MAGRIIDADKLKAHYAWWKGGTREMTMDEAKNDFDTIVDLQPTVELKPIVIDGEEYLTGADYNAYLKGYKDGKAEPTKHGQWLSVKVMDDEADFGETDGAECSVCGYTTNSEYWAKTYYHYCPNCGADMREVEDEVNRR